MQPIETPPDTIAQNFLYVAQWDGKLLWITRAEDLKTAWVDLRNRRNQSVTKGQFDDSVRTHGAHQALFVFAKLTQDWRAMYKPHAARMWFPRND